LFLKKIRARKEFEFFASKLMALIMKFSFRTTSWTVEGEEFPDSYHRKKVPFIVCLWHDRLMMAPCVWKWKKPLHVLASKHADGRLIAKIVENFSMPAVFGSSGKNGTAAAQKLVQLVKNGEYVAVIPDGPRGPRHRSAPGVATIAKLSRTDILPFSFCVKRYFRFNSWDKFIWVWPFNRGVQVWGKPVTAAELRSMSREEAVRHIESKINEAAVRAREILENA
jgi:lysophospholipid acyltransferase (LPLAT)-like uncharacterized protein